MGPLESRRLMEDVLCDTARTTEKMASAFKALLDGWKSKGRYPSISPDVARPFTDTALAYLEDEPRMLRLFEVVCTDDSAIRAFRFSHQLLPFVVGSFWATACYSRKPESFAFVNDALIYTLSQLFNSGPSKRFGDLIVNESEINLSFIMLQSKGVMEFDRRGMLDMQMDYAVLAKFFHGLRSKQMRQIFDHVSKGAQSEEVLRALSMKAGELFVQCVTRNVTEKKIGAAAFNILELIFQFSDAVKRDS